MKGTENCKRLYKLTAVSPSFATLGLACTLALFAQIEVEGLSCLLGPCVQSPGTAALAVAE